MFEPATLAAPAAAIESLKIPPHSIEAEQAVLGGLMLNNAAFDDVGDRITPADFYRHDHRLLFEAIRKLADINAPFDVVTLTEVLAREHQLEDAGGLVYIGEIARNTPGAANIKAYADIVRERSILRQLIRVSGEIADSAFHPEGRPVSEILDAAETGIFRIAENRKREGGPELLDHFVGKVIDMIQERSSNPGTVTGISTGFDRLDEMTTGLHPGELVIVAGRPSMDKTTFAMNLAESAVMAGRPVLVFSMEMPKDQLVLRMLSSLGRIDQTRLRTGHIGGEDWDRIISTFGILKDRRFYIDDTPALSPNDLRARARRVARENEGKLGLIVVDYLQLMQVPGNQENRANEISAISRSLKAIAKELEVPVVALSQLNRSLEQRPDKRPVMSDLRESGAIEQDADLIMFVFREEVYLQKAEDNKSRDRLEQIRGLAEIIIGKQRNGPIGKVNLRFEGKFTRFDNYVGDNYADYGA